MKCRMRSSIRKGETCTDHATCSSISKIRFGIPVCALMRPKFNVAEFWLTAKKKGPLNTPVEHYTVYNGNTVWFAIISLLRQIMNDKWPKRVHLLAVSYSEPSRVSVLLLVSDRPRLSPVCHVFCIFCTHVMSYCTHNRIQMLIGIRGKVRCECERI